MNAIDLLKRQHKEALQLIQDVKDAEDPSDKQDLFDECADTIALHLCLEEQSFYPAVKTAETEDMLLEAVEEHLAAKRVLADLLDTPIDDKTFPAKLEVLEVTLQHHIAEEEQQMFPKLQKVCGAKRLASLGEELDEAQEDLLGQGNPRNVIPDQTEEAAPL
jgi:hemerythrin superfamily protein